MEKDTYLTISDESEGLYKEKGSKFISYAFPVYSEEDIKNYLTFLRKKYYDARHHCYAWMIGFDGNSYRANDDGEPNHSAGDPILGQIRSRNLTNVLVVVVRYFGGIKLGVSGLINAYKLAAAEALNNAQIVERIIKDTVIISFDYIQMNEVMKLVKEYDLEITSQKFDNSCDLTVLVRKNLIHQLRKQLEDSKLDFTII